MTHFLYSYCFCDEGDLGDKHKCHLDNQGSHLTKLYTELYKIVLQHEQLEIKNPTFLFPCIPGWPWVNDLSSQCLSLYANIHNILFKSQKHYDYIIVPRMGNYEFSKKMMLYKLNNVWFCLITVVNKWTISFFALLLLQPATLKCIWCVLSLSFKEQVG